MSIGASTSASVLMRVPEAHVDERVEPRLTEVLVRLGVLRRLELAPDDDASAVVLHRGGQVEGRDAERGPELDDSPRLDAARDEVEHLPLGAGHGEKGGAHATAEALLVRLSEAEEVGDDERRDERDAEEIAARARCSRSSGARDLGVEQRVRASAQG